ncbi:hypothetical protein [Macrococcoides caseolyticum]|uniref:hypothetical protein n=1 Tax=Macrococcoides caseolyticum TaxID=69966 RepID=UPI0010607F7F|nr:hypothetical protein [Macrococcus caseolyticus]TDM18842.1 hypothetical protein ETI00_02470 [Macrococcus caseolyticus]
MTTLKINGKEVKTNGYFATNGQHYLVIEDDADLKAAKESVYEVLPIEKIEEDWNEYGGNYASITNWKNTTGYVGQAKMIENEYDGETDYFREPTVFEWLENGKVIEPEVLIGNMSEYHGRYNVYIIEVGFGVEKGTLYINVPKEVIFEDKIDSLNNVEHHKPFYKKLRDKYETNNIGYKMTKLEDGFTNFLDLNKNMMIERSDYIDVEQYKN